MIEAMLKSAIILAAAACVAWIMRRQSAAVRHTVWTAGLLGAMAIPAFTLALPSWPATNAIAFVIDSVRRITGSLGAFRDGAIIIWLAGAALGMLLLFYGAVRLAWVAIHSEPVEDLRWTELAEDIRTRLGIRRPVRLLQNSSVPFLGTWGIVAPRVLLPADAESWPDDRIRMVLGHELAHIKRHDWMVQVLADAARAIYWFNPIFWLASSRLRRESEHACDDAVVRMGVANADYAEELLNMTRTLHGRSQSPILAMAQPSQLEQRLVALLNPSLNRLAATPWAVIVVSAAAIALTVPLASVRSHEAHESAPETAPTPTPTGGAVYDRALFPANGDSPAMTKSARSQTAPPVRSRKAATETEPFAVPAPIERSPEPPAFDCQITPSVHETRPTPTKQSFGDGPWFMNEDKTIWAADQPYVAGRELNTIWLKPASTDLVITGRRLDADTTSLLVRPPAIYNNSLYLSVGMTFPQPGCWEVTASAGDSKLTFITKVQE